MSQVLPFIIATTEEWNSLQKELDNLRATVKKQCDEIIKLKKDLAENPVRNGSLLEQIAVQRTEQAETLKEELENTHRLNFAQAKIISDLRARITNQDTAFAVWQNTVGNATKEYNATCNGNQ